MSKRVTARVCVGLTSGALSLGVVRLMAKVAVMAAAVVAAVMAVAVQEVGAARILIAQPIGGRSHKNFFMGIAENLAQRNHTVSCAPIQQCALRSVVLGLKLYTNTTILSNVHLVIVTSAAVLCLWLDR